MRLGEVQGVFRKLEHRASTSTGAGSMGGGSRLSAVAESLPMSVR